MAALASSQLIVGGTSGGDGPSGKREANHFLVDSATLRSTPFSFLPDGEQDVNYSVVVLALTAEIRRSPGVRVGVGSRTVMGIGGRPTLGMS